MPARKKPVGAQASLAQKAYEAIKRRILQIHYRPGQHLNESTICEELDLGRTPVHQALQRLMLEGMVEVVPRKGVTVRAISIEEILELMEARAIVEPACAALAAEKASAESVKQMTTTLSGARSALRRHDREGFMTADEAFHSLVSSSTRNRSLADFIAMLHQRSQRLWLLHVWEQEDYNRTQDEHEQVLDAIRERKPDRAAAAMQEHLQSLRKRIAKMMSSG